ncbi:X-Pro dipeptidyl-peptidase [Lentzea albidocapillata subsp. violacea]|uniref:X-Pro dipeptidyl-peptidase n=1 Tax=Lentzea albidocapillata subsp. violacea TaxID=128104 RepID=A0A1G8QS41_9PSEU|nr:CocE/NonD family hydrolase [Lentzea albidocapillata]SDJ07527.1 X-Pro dipeptidyl-peptidase [Lentzea albidocapillata subsp. violacea]
MRRVYLVTATLLMAATIYTPASNAAPAAAAITETVYVESTIDSDADGKLDRIAADVMRPDTAGRVPIVMEASPYYGLGAAAATATNVPRGFRRWYDEYFVPRGYAVVEMEMQGTSRSTGCPTTGGPEDTASVRAVVDWLNGRAKAFYADGRAAVASWSTGNVGMLGVSYNGTLPNAAAAANIPGVKTIVPIAAISSWYEYARDQGIGYKGWERNYPTFLANYVVSAAQKAKCKPVFDRLSREDGDESYDYTSFWKARDYRVGAQNVSASVFAVHGQADWNVKPSQFGRWWEELADRNVPRKIWLHRGGHLDPISFRQAEWQRVMGLWMDHWLKGADNGIMNEPMADVQKSDGSWEQAAAWPRPDTKDTTLYFGPAAGGMSGSLTTAPVPGGTQTLGANANISEATMMANPETASTRRLAYVTAPLTKAARLSGEVSLTVRIASNRASTPLTALLVDYGPSTQAVLSERSPLQLSTEVCGKNDLRDRTGCARPPDVSIQAVSATMLTKGAVDAKNRLSLETATPLPTNGSTADVTWKLHARDALIPAGHRIGIVLVTNHSAYITVDTAASGVSLNVSLGVSKVVLPIVGGALNK